MNRIIFVDVNENVIKIFIFIELVNDSILSNLNNSNNNINIILYITSFLINYINLICQYMIHNQLIFDEEYLQYQLTSFLLIKLKLL